MKKFYKRHKILRKYYEYITFCKKFHITTNVHFILFTNHCEHNAEYVKTNICNFYASVIILKEYLYVYCYSIFTKSAPLYNYILRCKHFFLQNVVLYISKYLKCKKCLMF